MDALPSYEEAISPPDWLNLVAPFVPISDWCRCCLVNSHFYRHFAKRLWLDPLVTVRRLGLHPNDDLAWYRRLQKRISHIRLSTRGLVRCLDFRDFAVGASGLYSTEASERAISESFRALPHSFPHLLCLLMHGNPEVDPGTLAGIDGVTHERSQPLQLLDLAHCPYELTPKLFRSSFFRDLVYLDISWIPGSIKSAVQSSLSSQTLPELRILKAAGREMDDTTLAMLCHSFRRQLWSLDVSNNKLTDASIGSILEHCYVPLSFRSPAHFEREGKLDNPRQLGTLAYGPFDILVESDFSATYSHPQRYEADAPPYMSRADQGDLREWQTVRSDGASFRRKDNANAIKKLLLQNATISNVSSERNMNQQLRASQGGLTHLYISDNLFTSAGVEKLLRSSFGRLEHLDCNPYRPLSPGGIVARPVFRAIRLCGLFGAAPLTRPVFSSNLRSLRVHHSFVTQIPSLFTDDLSYDDACIMGETTFRERIEMAFPQAFYPDTNPRVLSLVLTSIPPRSVGPLISKITKFLDLASVQQSAIETEKGNDRYHVSSMLKGLRHIRFELDPLKSEDSPPVSGAHYRLDELLDPAGDSLDLGDVAWDIQSQSRHSSVKDVRSEQRRRYSGEGDTPSSPHAFTHPVSEEHVMCRVNASDSWRGHVFSVPVWVGTGIPGPMKAVNEYMANLGDIRLHKDVGPASPNHIAAGIPSGSYIFHAAWDTMIYPKSLEVPRAGPWRDVAAAIKEYRQQTKGTPNHWTGRLELVRTDSSARYMSSEYWR